MRKHTRDVAEAVLTVAEVELSIGLAHLGRHLSRLGKLSTRTGGRLLEHSKSREVRRVYADHHDSLAFALDPQGNVVVVDLDSETVTPLEFGDSLTGVVDDR